MVVTQLSFIDVVKNNWHTGEIIYITAKKETQRHREEISFCWNLTKKLSGIGTSYPLQKIVIQGSTAGLRMINHILFSTKAAWMRECVSQFLHPCFCWQNVHVTRKPAFKLTRANTVSLKGQALNERSQLINVQVSKYYVKINLNVLQVLRK